VDSPPGHWPGSEQKRICAHTPASTHVALAKSCKQPPSLKAVHISQTKHASLKTGGPQYYRKKEYLLKEGRS
jgi:hypothetical protein